MKSISVELGNGRKLVANIGDDPKYPEIYIDLVHANGTEQQIACCSKNDSGSDDITVFVWNDENSDDYCVAYTVKPRKEKTK